jgi:glycine/D-amino acid oxidase-like deaminating enzyme
MQKQLDALKNTKLGSVWHDPDVMPEPLPPLSGDTSCELLIVGGGFTGLWAALQVKEREPKTDVILIEKTFVGDGASGRCGGFIQHYLAHGETNTAERFPGEAERLEELGKQNLKELLESLERYGIDAHYEKSGRSRIALDETSAAELHNDYQVAKAAGLDVVWFNKDEMRGQVNSPKFHGGVWYRDGQNGTVDPGRLCWGLKKVLIELGVRIFEDTPLLNFAPLDEEIMHSQCEDGAIFSKKIMMATNAYPSKISRLNRPIIPVWDYQLATEPLTEEQLQSIGWHKSRIPLGSYANMFHYSRLTKDNRITWGGGGAVRYYFNKGIDKHYEDAQARYEQLASEFYDIFPQLKNVKFSHKWGGIIATSTRFCMVPGVAHEGRVAWCVGYTGLGVGATRFGARIGIELLGYQPSAILDMKFVTSRTLPWAPEPLRWLGVKLTQSALLKADKNGGKRGLWLKFLDMLNLGFTC